MKVRVIKEMPFAKVGEVFETDVELSITIEGIWIHTSNIEQWIRDGWLEEVKEESWTFEDRVRLLTYQSPEKIALLAKKHYLEMFDKVNKNMPLISTNYECISIIRKALEQA